MGLLNLVSTGCPLNEICVALLGSTLIVPELPPIRVAVSVNQTIAPACDFLAVTWDLPTPSSQVVAPYAGVAPLGEAASPESVPGPT